MTQNHSSRRRLEDFKRDDPLEDDPLASAREEDCKVSQGVVTLEVTVSGRGLAPITLEDYPNVFKDIPYRPLTLNLLHLKADKIEALGRPGRRQTIVALAETEAEISLQIAATKTDRFKGFRRRAPDKSTHNLAIVTILALALNYKSGEPRMVPELVALSPPSTMGKFRSFCYHPFIKFSDMSTFVHVVARNVAHDDEGGADQPIAALRVAAEIVADLLAGTKKVVSSEVKERAGQLSEDAKLFEDCLRRWSNDIDRGIQVGLVLAGVRKYFERFKNRSEKRYDVALGLVDVVLAGLTGIPVAGFVSGIIQSVTAQTGKGVKDRHLATIDEMYAAVIDQYYEKVEFLVHKDGQLGSGANVYAVDAVVFSRWVNLVLKYNTITQI